MLPTLFSKECCCMAQNCTVEQVSECGLWQHQRLFVPCQKCRSLAPPQAWQLDPKELSSLCQQALPCFVYKVHYYLLKKIYPLYSVELTFLYVIFLWKRLMVNSSFCDFDLKSVLSNLLYFDYNIFVSLKGKNLEIIQGAILIVSDDYEANCQ